MLTTYSTAKVPAKDGGRPLDLDPDLVKIMSESRDYDELLWAWKGWRDAVGPAIKPMFTKLVEYMNKGAKEQGGLTIVMFSQWDFKVKLTLIQCCINQ